MTAVTASSKQAQTKRANGAITTTPVKDGQSNKGGATKTKTAVEREATKRGAPRQKQIPPEAMKEEPISDTRARDDLSQSPGSSSSSGSSTKMVMTTGNNGNQHGASESSASSSSSSLTASVGSVYGERKPDQSSEMSSDDNTTEDDPLDRLEEQRWKTHELRKLLRSRGIKVTSQTGRSRLLRLARDHEGLPSTIESSTNGTDLTTVQLKEIVSNRGYSVDNKTPRSHAFSMWIRSGRDSNESTADDGIRESGVSCRQNINFENYLEDNIDDSSISSKESDDDLFHPKMNSQALDSDDEMEVADESSDIGNTGDTDKDEPTDDDLSTESSQAGITFESPPTLASTQIEVDGLFVTTGGVDMMKHGSWLTSSTVGVGGYFVTSLSNTAASGSTTVLDADAVNLLLHDSPDDPDDSFLRDCAPYFGLSTEALQEDSVVCHRYASPVNDGMERNKLDTHTTIEAFHV